MEAGEICDWRPLGSLLREQAGLTATHVEDALAYQEHAGGLLGEILRGWGFISGPLLARVLAEQHGVQLEQETGFGTGLRAEIERRHRHGQLLNDTSGTPGIETLSCEERDV